MSIIFADNLPTPALDEALEKTAPFYQQQRANLGPGVAAAFDLTAIIASLREIFSMLASLCSGGFFTPPPRPEEVAIGMVDAANGLPEKRHLLSQLWRSCEITANRNIERDGLIIGGVMVPHAEGRLRGRELRALRYDSARRNYWTMVDSARTIKTEAERKLLADAIAEAREI